MILTITTIVINIRMIKSKFLEFPSFIMVPDGSGHWVSDERMVYYYAPLDIEIVIEPGATNNLASIPWYLRKLFPINGPSRPAAALHDPLYGSLGIISGHTLSRLQCDDIFKSVSDMPKIDYLNAISNKHYGLIKRAKLNKALETEDPMVSPFKSKLMYDGVRLGGWYNWNQVKRIRDTKK